MVVGSFTASLKRGLGQVLDRLLQLHRGRGEMEGKLLLLFSFALVQYSYGEGKSLVVSMLVLGD